MCRILLLFVGLFLVGNFAMAQLEERTEPLPYDTRFVPVDLNPLANHKTEVSLPGKEIQYNKLPFDLVSADGKNNLFLHKAGWPDWESDPKRYYALYDETPKESTEELPVIQIPVDDYSGVYILASSEEDPKYSNTLSLRIGVKRSRHQTTYHDYEFTVPRRGEKGGEHVVRALPAPHQDVFLLRLPLNAALSQDFQHHQMLDVEITKKIRLSVTKPDAARYQYRPLGLPSGVHIYGMTFERAGMKVSFEGTEIGNVFNEPQVPTFKVNFHRIEPRLLRNLVIRSKAVDYYGNVINFPEISNETAQFAKFPTLLKFPVPKRGYYVLTMTIEQNKKVFLEKQTTFALLPKDTRKYRTQGPFGTWDFGGSHYTPNDPDVVGPLYVKAGLRYGMFGYRPEDRKRYGILKGNDPKVNARTDLSKLDDQIAAVKATGETPKRWLLFHEDAISGNHITRVPDVFTGKKYQFNEEEKAKLEQMIHIIEVTVPKVRAAFPGIKFDLGNGNPHLMEEFLRHNLSPDLFDALGNEAAAFQRLPESQPLDFIANNASIWMERHILDHYGYSDKKVIQSYEVMYPNSNPGNLTLRQQANHLVRHVMHSLAWKIPTIRFEGIADPGNSYYHSNWGGTGLMFGLPNLSPKPIYVATATMTQLLDGAVFSRIIPTGTTTVYAFEFKSAKGGFITCLWTPNTSRPVAIQTTQSLLKFTDLMSNIRELPTTNNQLVMDAEADPIFIESSVPLKIQAKAVERRGELPASAMILASLGNMNEWANTPQKNTELESYNFMQPRSSGKFSVQKVEEFEGVRDAVEVKHLNTSDERWWMPEYTQIEFKKPIPVAGQPTHIGLMVNGNGGWGRVVFELEDAVGQRWVSLGAEQKGEPSPWLADWMSAEQMANMKSAGISDWNSNDVWGRSMINFVGWNPLRFAMPGNYPGEGYHWPYTSQWRCVQKDGTPGDYKVHYPLKITKLSVTARPKVLYGTEILPVRRPEIYLKDLFVEHGDPDTVFWKPDPGQQ